MAEKEKEAEETAESPEAGGEFSEEGGGKKSKKKLIIILAAVLLMGVGAALFLTGIIGGGNPQDQHVGEGGEVTDPLLAPQIVYLDMEEFLVNLNNPGRQVSFLKMTVTLELPNLMTKQVLETNMPRIRDSFQIYLRELRSSDLQGSAGIHRLKEELLLRINKLIAPEKINDILFKEIIVQ